MLPASIQRFLVERRAQFLEIHHPRTQSLNQAAASANVPTEALVRAVTLIDARGPILAVLPYHHLLNFTALCEQLGRDLEPVSAAQLQKVFYDCETQCCPPFAQAYGMDMIIDAAILDQDIIYLEPGSHTTLLQMSARTFRNLHPDALVRRFSVPAGDIRSAGLEPDYITHLKPAHVKQAVEAVHELPTLPTTAAQIMEIAANPNAGANDLGKVIELDPPLAAKVLQYANSPLYGFPGKIADVKNAIARVLGFDFVLNLALGISVSKTLHIPTEGPLGLDAYWQHAVYCAALSERLAQNMPPELKVRRGTVYLAGLLHNLGILLLGQVFQSEFFLLNRYMMANPHRPMQEVERFLLGVGHDQIGSWLMQAWGLPDELAVAARHHHNADYWDQHALYAQTVLIADRALNRIGIGFDSVEDFPAFSLEMLGLTENQVMEITADLQDNRADLDALAQIAA